jgi:hypothetical protein
MGCFLEVFRSFRAAVPSEELDSRRLARIEVHRDLVLADPTEPRARFWGITGEIHSTHFYEQTQAWAETFANAGFDGIRYLLRHDPSQRQAGIALFGPREPLEKYPAGESHTIDRELILDVEKRFGIRVI